MERKKEEVLKDLEGLFVLGFLEEEVEVYGVKFKLRTLNDGERVWRDRYVPLSVSSDVVSARKAPTLAIAIRAINGISVEELFSIENEGDKVLEGITEPALREIVGRVLKVSGDEKKFKVAERVLEFLRSLSPEVVDRLWDRYVELERRVSECLKQGKN